MAPNVKPKGPAEMLDKILANLPETTGKDAKAWAKAVLATGISAKQQQVSWLMAQGVGRIAATTIADHLLGDGKDYTDQDGLLEKMYAGPKADLRPIYERLVAIGEKLGPEFSYYQCAGQTTFKRGRQFAWIKPSTRTRLDLGLALPGMEAGGRLLPVSGTNDKDRVRLRIAISSVGEVDDEVEKWLRRAWDLEAGG